MQHHGRCLWIVLLMAGLCFGLSLSARGDVCAVCGKPISGTIYLVTDKVTGEQKEVCSDCIKLPRCSICGLPVKDGTQLPDGRYLCARDARTVVLKADDARQICSQVKDDLDRLFSRFTSFPTNVDVSVIDRVDVDSMFITEGHNFESPDLLGCIRPETVNNQTRYKMSLLTGLPLAQLKETCAHEYSHAWVGENVPKERRARLGRDAEEGFCELVGYLLMDSQNEEVEKKRVLQNHYTRGQIDLFIEAEKRYGFDQVLDWMKYGEAAQLEAGHVDELRDARMPAAKPVANNPAIYINNNNTNQPATAPATIKLQGVLWGNQPVAIINGRSFFSNELKQVKIGGTNVTLRCLEIRKKSVRIQNIDSGEERELLLPPN
ncbi:MAG: protein DA1 [Limisphaerales bacterium]